MIDFLGFSPDRSYFSAYNGYQGFRSLFDRTFDPLRHTRVYILKGGPGTGKSTILKGIIKWANGMGIASEAIYCSSDPSSLDGVVLRRNDKSISILDGTAPHTFDPKYPGAKDEIINLGDSFNTELLSDNSAIICSLGKEKAAAYEDAYSYLGIAGAAKKLIDKKYERSIDLKRLDETVDSLKKRTVSESTSDTYETFCISSFGRYGYTRLDELFTLDKTVIGIKGDGYTEYYVMNKLAENLINEKKVFALCPSPFGDRTIEAIYTENYLFVTGIQGDIEIETHGIVCTHHDTKATIDIYNTALELAKDSFELASEKHFKIEDIYSSCMDFENNEKIFYQLIDKIDKLLA